ncbi:glycosyltransferase involved in cell wall biosynthesis [Novosphingobium chloroacetimidivorans]|uniref:Glycosyltransferase involved in cell wall biosynthesis n=1 Tax=Novosphingobium chloroacetimidivorans TaxID=1428314 RepID=A0A7W7KCF1_9SPHN|nr:glycosyltransferase family 1 protein [Novosphingobium chloroacetimidivorans]MBB4859503.1 glycosyltransferase involved in cell wall biosynthesis [Novosphingobium chloroacetimidivorans]
MNLVIATDAWFPQVNGVVRSLSTTLGLLRARGHYVEVIAPDRFLTMPMPGYASIRLAMAPRFGVRRMLDSLRPELVHIATEGPIGWAARGWCLSRGVPFTSAFHTRFPEYAAVRTGISAERFWPIMRRFHAPSSAVLVSTRSLADELGARGIGPTMPWSRGIDDSLFRPEGPRHPAMTALPGPVLLNVGRVATEKNLGAFLDLDVPGSKVVVGDGPALAALRRKYPHVLFLGPLSGEALASAYRAADCFVFPSRTDTFGLVVIEALACGVPVAGYPVTGPIDILGAEGRGVEEPLPQAAGVLDESLAYAIDGALSLDRGAAASLGMRYSWERATDQFEHAITVALAGPADRIAA